MKKYAVIQYETTQHSYGRYWIVSEFDSCKEALEFMNSRDADVQKNLELFEKVPIKRRKKEVIELG